ncbi:MAG: HlyD family efflux transporter periplasmic adaptor subunit [Bacteroidetes bacterium]|nr:MAG: HlyD family efflux transporter periplasmic adaptor subunit [Bacteroidota bacterium]
MNKFFLFSLLIFLLACQNGNELSDAYGNFEAKEVLVAAEANGKIMHFEIEDGRQLSQQDTLGYIDTLQLHLKKKQLQASIAAILSKRQDVQTQQQVYLEQKQNLLREKARLEKLLAEGAATPKQLDDISGQIEVVDKQMKARIKALETTNRGISSEVAPLRTQIEQIEDQIHKSFIINPIDGQVLAHYAEPSEVAVFGKPLYKIADTRTMFLRAYISGRQLPLIKTGQQVEVLIDQDEQNYRRMKGTIVWIASEAEFTPKVIQTKEARVNMVYAIKIKVQNDGSLKIGMPGEVRFSADDAPAE